MHSPRLRILFDGRGLLAQKGFFLMHLRQRGERNLELWRVRHKTIFYRMGSGGGGRILSAIREYVKSGLDIFRHTS